MSNGFFRYFHDFSWFVSQQLPLLPCAQPPHRFDLLPRSLVVHWTPPESPGCPLGGRLPSRELTYPPKNWHVWRWCSFFFWDMLIPGGYGKVGVFLKIFFFLAEEPEGSQNLHCGQPLLLAVLFSWNRILFEQLVIRCSMPVWCGPSCQSFSMSHLFGSRVII